MQTVRFNLKMNGWLNTLIIRTKIQHRKHIINVVIDVVGVVENQAALLDIAHGRLVPIHPITQKPYDETKKDKIFKSFRVPKEQLNQIRDYVDYKKS